MEADCLWLRQVFNWATKWRDERGHYLMRENPLRGYDVPTEKNPRRPVATTDRYRVLRAVSDQVMMEIRWDGRRRVHRSYLSELLDIAHGTGRRINAVCQLRYDDFRPELGQHGGLRWREDTDKMGREWFAPINASVRAALDRLLQERPGIGAAYVFPSPKGRTRPIRYDLAAAWLQIGRASCRERV